MSNNIGVWSSVELMVGNSHILMLSVLKRNLLQFCIFSCLWTTSSFASFLPGLENYEFLEAPQKLLASIIIQCTPYALDFKLLLARIESTIFLHLLLPDIAYLEQHAFLLNNSTWERKNHVWASFTWACGESETSFSRRCSLYNSYIAA